MNKIALITGATAGIGKATAQLLAAKNFDLILCGRRKERLDELSTELTARHNNLNLSLDFDIQNFEAIKQAFDNLPQKWQNISVLINNAGLGLAFDPIQDGKPVDWATMINTNVTGLLNVSHFVIKLMLKKQSGHIVNIGSTAASQVKKGTNVYSATKFAVDAITKGMRHDLVENNIKVSQINPGIVATEFAFVKSKGAPDAAEKSYGELTPLYPADVAEAIWYVVSAPQHVNINHLNMTTLIEADLNHRLNKKVY